MPANILIVDDSPVELRVLVQMLKRGGYLLTLAQNGAEGVERARRGQHGLVLMDVRMPLMDGFAACRHLKLDALTRDIPVVFLSALTDTPSRLEGLRLGACDYIAKPLVEEEVLLRVAVHLRRDVVVEAAPAANWSSLQLDWRSIAIPVGIVSATVDCACEAVMKQPGRGWSQEGLANAVGTHRKRLNEEFKEAYDLTVMTWVRNYRLGQASLWLRQCMSSVQGIARDLGFDSPAHFASTFRAHFGLSPTEYRQHASAGGPCSTPRLAGDSGVSASHSARAIRDDG